MSRSTHLGQGIVIILYISVLKLGKGVWSAHHGLRVGTGRRVSKGVSQA